MRYKKRIYVLYLVLLVLVTGCGKKEMPVDRKDMVYEAENIVPDAEVEGVVTAFAVWNDRVYVYAAPWETPDYDEEGNAIAGEQSLCGKCYSMKLDGSDTMEIQLPKVQGQIEQVEPVCSGTTLVLSITYRNQDIYGYAMAKVEEDGTVAAPVDLTEELQLGDNEQMEQLLAGKDGRLAAVTDRRIIVLEEDGKRLGEAAPESGYVQSAVCSKDGEILSADVTEDGVTVDVLDRNTFQWKTYQKLEGDVALSSNLLMNGAQYDYYYRDNSGIYGCDAGAKKTVKLLDYAASNIYTENVSSIRPIDDTRMLGIADAITSDGAKLILYTKVDPKDVADKEVITYGAIQLDTDLKNAIAQFNHSNSRYYVQIKEYYQESDPEMKLALDLVSDHAPDIINLSGMSLQQYGSKGVLEDLTPYYEKDKEVQITDLIPSVAKAIQTDGHYYYVTPGFRITALAGKTSVIGEDSVWTMEDVMRILSQYPDAQLFYDCGKEDLLNLFLSQGASSFVDWNTGTCYFDQERFRNLLEFCDQYDSGEPEYEIGQETERIQKNQVLVSPVMIGAENMQVYEAMYQEPVTYKGYPSDENGGTSFYFPVQLAMSAKSKNKEGAWEFLRMFLSQQYQAEHVDVRDGEEDMVPTRQDAFEQYQKVRMVTEAYTDASNHTILPMNLMISYDGQKEVQLEPMSEEQMQRFVDLVNETSRATTHEYSLQAIVEEEAKAYLEGQQTLDKTIAVIQDRTTKYVNENR